MSEKEQVMFASIKGVNDSDRLVATCLKEISKLIDGKTLLINDKLCKVRVVSKEPKTKLMFDILDPSDSLDHIEFNIEKTGWGMKLNNRK